MNAARIRNVYLDIFKFFLCYLVIAIHLAGETYSHFPLYRLAVPMFFIISGYFNRASEDLAEKAAFGFIKRTFRYMAAGFLLYIIFDFVMCYVDGHGVGYYFTTLFYEDFILEFFILCRPITYTGSQLWFLIALFVVSLIHFALVKYKKLHYYKVIVPVCYCIYFFFAGYMYLFQNTDMPVRYTRNALFFGLPNFGLGYLLAGVDLHKKKWYKYLYLILGILFFCLQIHEYHLVKTQYCSLEMYWSSILSAVFFLQFFLGIKNPGCDFYYKWVGKNASFWVYILHMAVAVVLSKFATFDDLMVKSFCVLAISFAVYEAAYLFGMAFRTLRARRSSV